MPAKRKGRNTRDRKPSTKKRADNRGRRKGDSVSDADVRKHVLELLKSEGAHAGLDAVLRDVAAELRGAKPEGTPYSIWQLLEHMRIAQWDILEFSRNSEHVSPKWPDGYWPETESPPTETAWEESIRALRRDLSAMEKLVSETPDLYARIPHGEGQTILREALLIADHNAYHLGQLVLMRRLLGAWKG